LVSSTPPAEAALAADLVIHGHLGAATAGIEAALAGVPTLLFDGEGWPTSPLYLNGKDKIVFTDWQTLWGACEAHWAHPGSLNGFGDWSRILETIDPFRDGRAAERMGTYFKWLLEGYVAGLSRAIILADAAERYSKIWGADKVSEVCPAIPFRQRDSQ
jgi:hypothetical protein